MSSSKVHLPPKVEQCGNVRIITFAPDVVRDVENVIARELQGRTDETGGCHLLLDFTNVEYITSVELGTLVRLHKQMKASGGRLTLFNFKAEVYEVFTTTCYKHSWAFAGRTSLSPPVPRRGELACPVTTASGRRPCRNNTKAPPIWSSGSRGSGRLRAPSGTSVPFILPDARAVLPKQG